MLSVRCRTGYELAELSHLEHQLLHLGLPFCTQLEGPMAKYLHFTMIITQSTCNVNDHYESGFMSEDLGIPKSSDITCQPHLQHQACAIDAKDGNICLAYALHDICNVCSLAALERSSPESFLHLHLVVYYLFDPFGQAARHKDKQKTLARLMCDFDRRALPHLTSCCYL